MAVQVLMVPSRVASLILLFLGCAIAVPGVGSAATRGPSQPRQASESTGAQRRDGAPEPETPRSLVSTEEATLLAPDGASDDHLGESVALSADGTRAVVGAPDDDAPLTIAGSARVFARTGSSWGLEATLVAPDALAFDSFGHSVAISADGSRIVVGAPEDDTAAGSSAGSAHVFSRTGTVWTHETTLISSGGAANDAFGTSVAITADGTRALVGARSAATTLGADRGDARVFLRTGTSWAEEATLSAPDGAAGDALGVAVALSSDGSRALVGANGDDTPAGTNVGTARVFERTGSTWTQQASLTTPDGAPLDQLGTAVALSSDGVRALVGAVGDDTIGGLGAGSASVFVESAGVWVHEATLTAPDGAPNDQFGTSVALSADGSRSLVGTPADASPIASAGSARVFVRTGMLWAHEAALVADGAEMGDFFGSSVALSADGTRALVGARGDDTSGGMRAGTARVITIALAPDGASCGGDAACASGFCTDGVCCTTRCSGGPSDCQACSTALTGAADGICAVLSPAAAPTVVCRPASDACDAAETCTPTMTTCPTDDLATAGTPCRPAAGDCDVVETCTGTSAVCPADGLAAPSVVCRASASACDADERCSGSSVDCPGDLAAGASTVCRPAAGSCDVEERCDGVGFVCPGDAVASAGVGCGGTGIGSCSSASTCDGTGVSCPGAIPRPAGTVCLPRSPTSPCDVDDVCDGTTDVCRAAFLPAGTECQASSAEVCDAPDHCTGASGECPAEFLSGVECRPAAGACDTAEACLGDSPSCPPDAVESAGMVCRASTGTICDPPEICDGTATSCPTDVIACTSDAGARDGGAPLADVGSGVDSGASTDAGTSVAATGCGCRTWPIPAPTPLGTVGLALAVLAVRSRRAAGRCEVRRRVRGISAAVAGSRARCGSEHRRCRR